MNWISGAVRNSEHLNFVSSPVVAVAYTTELCGGAGPTPSVELDGALAVSAPPAEEYANELRFERIRAARMKGYEGDSCGECGNFIRNGTCLKCDTCGATSGCS